VDYVPSSRKFMEGQVLFMNKTVVSIFCVDNLQHGLFLNAQMTIHRIINKINFYLHCPTWSILTALFRFATFKRAALKNYCRGIFMNYKKIISILQRKQPLSCVKKFVSNVKS
jgi:hypothetical protein